MRAGVNSVAAALMPKFRSLLQTVELEQAMQDPVNDVLGVYGGRGKGKGKGFGKGNMPGKGSRR